MYQTLRKYLTSGIIATAIALSPLEAIADTVYYGELNKDKKYESPAYIVFDDVKTESKYHKRLPMPNDPNYDKILQQRNDSVYKAIEDVAIGDDKKDDKYDVVVEESDPKIKEYVNITEEVIKKLEENEKKED